MFDFQKEVIINSKFLEDGTTPRFTALEGPVKLFRVLRSMDYKAEGIVNNVIYKTAPNPGQVATATFDVPTEAGTYRVLIGISLDERYLADYAMVWYKFAKPVFAEFELGASDVGNANGQKIMMKAIEMAVPENYRFIKVAAESTNKVRVSCVDSHQVIKLAKIQKAEPTACPADLCAEVNYVDHSEAVVVKNKMEVGTAAWLQENLRFPSYANLRYMALNSEEYPVAGGQYYQYSFQYISPRRGLHGQGTVGQQLVSVTTHTYYVLDSLHTEFEEAIKKGLGDIIQSVKSATYDVEILNDPYLVVADLAEGAASKVDIKTAINGPAITGDVSNVKLSVSESTDSKYEIAGSKLALVASQSAAVGDKITVVAEYGDESADSVIYSKTSKVFTVIA